MASDCFSPRSRKKPTTSPCIPPPEKPAQKAIPHRPAGSLPSGKLVNRSVVSSFFLLLLPLRLPVPEKVPEGSTGRESRVGPVGGLARWRRWPGRNKQHRKTGGTRNTAFYIYLLLLPGFFSSPCRGRPLFPAAPSCPPNGVADDRGHWTPPHQGSDFYHSKVSVNPLTIIQAKQKSNKRPSRRSKLHKELRIFRSNVDPSFSLCVCECVYARPMLSTRGILSLG